MIKNQISRDLTGCESLLLRSFWRRIFAEGKNRKKQLGVFYEKAAEGKSTAGNP